MIRSMRFSHQRKSATPAAGAAPGEPWHAPAEPLCTRMREEVGRLAALIGARRPDLPDWGSSAGAAHPHVELRGDVMAFVVAERGVEYVRWTTTDLGELLFWVFDAVAGSMAGSWELERRVPYVESRLVKFAKHLELLEQLDEAWPEARLAEYVQVLATHPYSTADYPADATRAAVDFLLGSVREAPAGREPTEPGAALATSALIARGLREHGVGLGEIRRVDVWARRLPAPPREEPAVPDRG